jgi:AcrR family transcriptional regulator
VSLNTGKRVVSVELGLGGLRARDMPGADGAVQLRRAKLQQALVELVGERGFAGISVGLVVARAGVSRRTFYDLYGGLEGCFVAVLDSGFERVRGLMDVALGRAESGPGGPREALAESGPGGLLGWAESGPGGLREALAGLLVLLDEQPLLARVWLLESRGAGPRVLAHREQRMAQLRELILARLPLAEGSSRPPLAAEGTFAAVLGILETHLRERRPGPLLDLLGPLMGLAIAPYLGLEAARHEAELGNALARQIAAARAARHASAENGNGGVDTDTAAGSQALELALPGTLGNPSAHRARGCVLYLAAHPGSSNREIAEGVGVRGKEQISKLLARLADQDLVAKSSTGKGLANAWRLTEHGERAVAVLAGVARTHGERPEQTNGDAAQRPLGESLGLVSRKG